MKALYLITAALAWVLFLPILAVDIIQTAIFLDNDWAEAFRFCVRCSFPTVINIVKCI